jgi:small subunit ribosomal protein S21
LQEPTQRTALSRGCTRRSFLGFSLEGWVQVFVRDNDVNAALRVLKRKMQREGTFREMKRRRSYEKPSVRRAREKAEAIPRTRKALRKRMEREGIERGNLQRGVVLLPLVPFLTVTRQYRRALTSTPLLTVTLGSDRPRQDCAADRASCFAPESERVVRLSSGWRLRTNLSASRQHNG